MDAAAYPAVYLAVADVVLGNEGGLSMVASDPGNWTGGAVKLGTLKGTKWGLSAAVFPTLDIANLTRDQAIAIYYPLYFQKASCGLLPAQLALLVMDAAVNNGVGRAVRWLQAAAGVNNVDGLFGKCQLGRSERAAGASARARRAVGRVPDPAPDVYGRVADLVDVRPRLGAPALPPAIPRRAPHPLSRIGPHMRLITVFQICALAILPGVAHASQFGAILDGPVGGWLVFACAMVGLVLFSAVCRKASQYLDEKMHSSGVARLMDVLASQADGIVGMLLAHPPAPGETLQVVRQAMIAQSVAYTKLHLPETVAQVGASDAVMATRLANFVARGVAAAAAPAAAPVPDIRVEANAGGAVVDVSAPQPAG